LPAGFTSFRHAIPKWLTRNVNLRRELRRQFGPAFRGEILLPSTTNHTPPALSSRHRLPRQRSSPSTAPASGPPAVSGSAAATASNSLGDALPHSLGLLYSAFTYFCGFKVNDGEYKLMGSPLRYATLR